MFVSNDSIKFMIAKIFFNLAEFKNYQIKNNASYNYHGKDTLEINFIKDGKGKLKIDDQIYELEKNYSINSIINTINQGDDDLISNSNEDKMIIKKNLALLKEKENDRFTLKSRTRLEQLMKTTIYVKSDIRLKFPN